MTIAEVARRAGVSRSTASSVRSGNRALRRLIEERRADGVILMEIRPPRHVLLEPAVSLRAGTAAAPRDVNAH